MPIRSLQQPDLNQMASSKTGAIHFMREVAARAKREKAETVVLLAILKD